MNIKKMFVWILLAVFPFLFGSEPKDGQQADINHHVWGNSIEGSGIYIVSTYSTYPKEQNSSYTFWILNLDDTFEYTDDQGIDRVQSYGGMGLSLVQQEMSGVEFGFEAWGPYSSIQIAQDQVEVLVAKYQKKYPLAGVKGYHCVNAYFEANSPLSNEGWCP